MKTNILILLFLSVFLKTNAQITLEHSFPAYATVTDFNGAKYYFINENIVTFYNADYSFDQTLTIPVPYGYKVSSFSNFYDKLFNLDATYEYTCSFQDTLNNTGYLLKLFDISGSELFDFGNSNWGYPHSMNTAQRFGVYRYTTTGLTYEIYSLPGSISYMNNKSINENEIHPFPNPAKNFIYLPYKIDFNDVSNMKIINSNGQVIDNKKIGSDFDNIKLDISNYNSGIYFYEYNSKISKFIVE